ncbi:sensor histidine kinase [Pedobacter sp. KLB.chiD]|uniref:sensor histidine kinase n=1 Tax=Pedobacter sp. KLB.chiD TaxID=3387402 RepID=UPI00399A65F7
MKKIILSIFLFIFAFWANAQKINNNGLVSYGDNSSYLVGGSEGFGVYLTADTFTKTLNFHNAIQNQLLSNLVYLEGTKEIKLFGYINKDSLSFYRYNVVENDNHQIVSDATPLAKNATNFYQTGANVEINLGKFNVQNRKLTINLYKITNRSEIATIIIYNKKIQPAYISFIALNALMKGTSGVEMKNLKTVANFNINKNTLNLMIVINSTDLDFVYTVYLKDKSTGKIVFHSNNWFYGFVTRRTPYLLIGAEHFNKSGDYELLIVPKLSQSFNSKSIEKSTTRYSFHVNNTQDKLFSQKQLIIYGLTLCAICGVIFGAAVVFIKKKEAQKLALKHRDKEIAKLRLESVRSQLNPHFLFNALAGIQNLMNKNEIDNANRYLTKFARLTRNVLDHKDLISLTSEKKLLDDYLQMEQLRFGFQYHIGASPDLDAENIEIPAMLLQPFVENAVKYGVAEKGINGRIEINFIKVEADLILSITDNGTGFDAAKNYEGLGLALSKNRISLLNSIYKETPFILDIQSDGNGTTVKITFNQWL